MRLLPRDFAGGQNLQFFRVVPPYVDRKLAPGRSRLPPATLSEWIVNAICMRHMYASPNTVWAVISLIFYFAFPYDLSAKGAAASAPLSTAFFWERFPLWAVLTFGYTAFWHVTLYALGWGERPFVKRQYNVLKVVHNLVYSLVGIVIWVAFENVFTFLWATGRLPFLSDAEAMSTMSGRLNFLAALVLTPLWRDFHFYFAHRLLHFKPMYAQVHSLHHRNTDIEPFSGLTMHPVEHVYYYACILPSLLFYTTPFAFLWNGVHLLLAPGASHSGWEDHFQADAFHYLHHRYFEVNYAGFGAAFLDTAFGSFQECLKEDDDATARPDAKANIAAPPTFEYASYLTTAMGCLVAWGVVANGVATGDLSVEPYMAALIAALAGVGPVVLAILFTMVFRRVGVSQGGTSMFGKGSSAAATILHLVVGNAFCSLPIAWACYLTLRPASV
jgi:sterol desaturase/sphingolipid hydroxylase (fatty acid hydroxylase superfamily)